MNIKQAEALMWQAFEDSQNGVESDIGREVRLSLESQQNEALSTFTGPPRPIGHWPMKAKRKLNLH